MRVGLRFSLLFGALALGLAACGQPSSTTTATAPDGGELLPMTPGFVGRWAADASMCSFGAWDWRADGVTTAGEVSCTFSQVTPVPGGYDISAMCLAEGVSTPSQIRVRFPESAGGMTVDGGPWQPIGLTQCAGASTIPGMPPTPQPEPRPTRSR